MSHNGNNNPGNYPAPPNEGYVVPSDHELPVSNAGAAGPVETIVGEEAVRLLEDFALELIGKNNLFGPELTFVDKNPDPPGAGLDSLYNSIIKLSKFHQLGQHDLEKLRDFFGLGGAIYQSQVLTSLNEVAQMESFFPIRRDELDKLAGTTTEVAQEFIKEIIKRKQDRNELGIENIDDLEVNKGYLNTFTSDEKTFTDKHPDILAQNSVYESIIRDTQFHKKGITDLDDLRDTFIQPGRVTSTTVTHKTLDAINDAQLHKRILQDNLNRKQGTKATKAFVEEIVKDKTQRDTLGISESEIFSNDDITQNDAYRKTIKRGGSGAEQVYTSERHFTADAPGEWISDLAELSGFGRSQLAAATAGPLTILAAQAGIALGSHFGAGLGGTVGSGIGAGAGLALGSVVGSVLLQDTSGPLSIIGDNAIINFFGGLAREFRRHPEKLVKWGINNTILQLQTPNVINPDQVGIPGITTGGGLEQALFDIANINNDGPMRGNVDAITRRMGPGLLSMIPSIGLLDKSSYGKGKFFNPMSLAGGGSLTFGEQLLPGTARTLDGVMPALGPVPLSITTSELRDKDSLEPYSAIAKIENPIHLAKNNILNRIGKNRWQLRNLTNTILRPSDNSVSSFESDFDVLGLVTKGGLYANDVVLDQESVKNIEQILEQEYVPFYFHDLRTNEIISFHAFFRAISESYAPTWNSEAVYGRVDNIQIYGGITARNISLQFTIVALNRVDFDTMWKKMNKFVTLVYPQYGEAISTKEGKSIPFSQPLRGAPIIRMRVGDLFKTNFSSRGYNSVTNTSNLDVLSQTGEIPENKNTANAFVDFRTFSKGLAGIITDLSFDYGTATWETAMGHVAPQLIEVSLSFTAIHDIAPGINADGINRAPIYTPFRDAEVGNTQFNDSTGDGSLDKTMTSNVGSILGSLL